MDTRNGHAQARPQRRAVDELRKSRDQFETIFNGIRDGIFVQDAEGRLIYANDSAARMAGYPAAREFLRTSDGERLRGFRVRAEDGARLGHAELPGALTLHDGEPHEMTIRYSAGADGTWRWAEVQSEPVRSEGGGVRYAVTVFHDVTLRRQAEQEVRESEARLQAIIDNSPTVVFVKDTRGRFVLVNREFERIADAGREDIIGKTDDDLFPRETAELTRTRDGEVLRENAPLKIEEVITRGEEARTYVSVKFPLAGVDGRAYAVGAISTDITERKVWEDLLRIRARQQEAVADLGRRALATDDLSALMRDAVCVVAETLDVPHSDILEVSADGVEIVPRAGAGRDRDPVRGAVADGLHALAAYVLRSGRPVIVEDCTTESRFPGAVLIGGPHPASCVSVVIPGHERPVGVLTAHAPCPRAFTTDDVHFMEAVANVLAAAIERRRTERAREIAVTEERERIAREMHDSLAQTLGYVNMQTQAVQQLLRGGDLEHASRQFEQLAQVAREAYADVREDILGLRTSLGPKAGIIDTLRSYLPRWQEQSGVAAELLVRPLDLSAPGVSASAELQLIRIVQEGLANVRKHARASRAQVHLSRFGESVEVVIEDDGAGFDPDEPRPSGFPRFGLATMRERAESVRAHFHIDSEPGRGTRVVVRLPIKTVRADPSGGSDARRDR